MGVAAHALSSGVCTTPICLTHWFHGNEFTSAVFTQQFIQRQATGWHRCVHGRWWQARKMRPVTRCQEPGEKPVGGDCRVCLEKQGASETIPQHFFHWNCKTTASSRYPSSRYCFSLDFPSVPHGLSQRCTAPGAFIAKKFLPILCTASSQPQKIELGIFYRQQSICWRPSFTFKVHEDTQFLPVLHNKFRIYSNMR